MKARPFAVTYGETRCTRGVCRTWFLGVKVPEPISRRQTGTFMKIQANRSRFNRP